MAKDIYKIDNYFISIGVLLIIVAAISIFADPRSYYELTITNGSTLKWEDREGRTDEQIIQEHGADTVITPSGFPKIRTIIGINGFVILAIGLFYRSREKKIISIWDALDRSGESKVQELAVSLGLSRDFILRHLKEINAQRNVYFVYQSDQDKIVDGKLMAEYVVVANCPGCGNNLNQKVSLHFSQLPTCRYCGTTISVDDLNKLKHEVMSSRNIVVEPPKSDFSVGVFVLLLIFFWPGAVAYVIIKKSNKIKNFSSQISQLQAQTQ